MWIFQKLEQFFQIFIALITKGAVAPRYFPSEGCRNDGPNIQPVVFAWVLVGRIETYILFHSQICSFLSFLVFDKLLMHLCKQCCITEALWKFMSLNLEKKTIRLLGIFSPPWNVCWLCKIKQFTFKDHSRDGRISNKTLKKWSLIEKWEFEERDMSNVL